MINIKVRNKIGSLKTVSEPDDWKLLTVKEDNILVPGMFLDGKRWTLFFKCSCCGKETLFRGYFKSPDYIAGGELHYSSFQNKEYLSIFGNLFDLALIDKGKDINNFVIFYYRINDDVARVDYFKCNHCNVQYLMASSKQHGGERPPTPDLVHIKGIYQVEFDEEEFFRLYKKYKVSS